MRRTIIANSLSETLNRYRVPGTQSSGFCGSPGEFENHFAAFKAARLVKDEPVTPAEKGVSFQPQEVGGQGVSLEDIGCANNYIMSNTSRFESVNWGRTAGLDTIHYKIPHYIMKGISRHPDRETSAVCIEMIVKLLLLGSANLMTAEMDEVGIYFRKGVKRTLVESERGQSDFEPGEGGGYTRFFDEGDEYDDDLEYPYQEDWYEDEESDMDMGDGFTRCGSQLNGSHGEWTESDDVAGKRQQRGKGGGKKRQPNTLPKRREPRPQPKKAVRRLARSVARETGIGFAANFIGEEAARGGYQMIARAMRPKTLSLSAVASKYLQSFVTPFGTNVSQASVPKNPATRSYKVTGFMRGTAYIGDTGMGFIALAPTLCKDRPCVYFSPNGYGMSTVAPPPTDLTYNDSAAGGGQYPANAKMSNLPYTYSELTTQNATNTNDIVGRIVSASLRVYYTGTTFYEAGQYLAYADPDNLNVLGEQHNSTTNSNGYSATSLSQKDACEITSVRRDKEISLVVLGVNEDMDDYARSNGHEVRKAYPYSSNSHYADSASAKAGIAPALIMVTGTADQPLYFEVVIHAEYIGPGVVQALLTDTVVDVVGYDAVKCVLQHAQREVAANPRLSFKQAVKAELARQRVCMGTGVRSVDY